MAGKHPNLGTAAGADAASQAATAGTLPPLFPGSKRDKAYARGRKEHVLDGANPFTGNPHPNGTPEKTQWETGALVGFNSATTHVGSKQHTGVPDK